MTAGNTSEKSVNSYKTAVFVIASVKHLKNLTH